MDHPVLTHEVSAPIPGSVEAAIETDGARDEHLILTIHDAADFLEFVEGLRAVASRLETL